MMLLFVFINYLFVYNTVFMIESVYDKMEN